MYSSSKQANFYNFYVLAQSQNTVKYLENGMNVHLIYNNYLANHCASRLYSLLKTSPTEAVSPP